MGKAKGRGGDAVQWCEKEHRPATRKALSRGTIELLDLGGGKRQTKRKSPVKAKRSKVAAKSLSDELRIAAKESGFSVKKIAEATGLDQSGLNRFLNGTRDNIRLDVADRLFQFFKLAVVRFGIKKDPD
jgi:hypothetical protein